MADKHPYTQASGNLVKAILQFRSSIPPKIDAPVLKKLGIAPQNESYLINILRFVNIIDENGKPTTEGRSTFTQHDDAEFGKKLSEMIKKAYSDLFSIQGDKAWELDSNALITYFRQADQTSGGVGKLQAATFRTLAGFAGHGEVPTARTPTTRKRKTAGTSPQPKTEKKSKVPSKQTASDALSNRTKDFGLTVRIEINLPVAGDQATYDRIFKSIRENLLNG